MDTRKQSTELHGVHVETKDCEAEWIILGTDLSSSSPIQHQRTLSLIDTDDTFCLPDLRPSQPPSTTTSIFPNGWRLYPQDCSQPTTKRIHLLRYRNVPWPCRQLATSFPVSKTNPLTNWTRYLVPPNKRGSQRSPNQQDQFRRNNWSQILLHEYTFSFLPSPTHLTHLIPQTEAGAYEAPGILKVDNVYFLIVSGKTGWRSNPNKAFWATSLAGPWTGPSDIAPVAQNTYNSQNTFELTIKGSQKTTYIYMGDSWDSKGGPDSNYVWLPVDVNSG